MRLNSARQFHSSTFVSSISFSSRISTIALDIIPILIFFYLVLSLVITVEFPLASPLLGLIAQIPEN